MLTFLRGTVIIKFQREENKNITKLYEGVQETYLRTQ